MDSLTVKGRKYKLPIFLPDATRGVVKGIDSLDLQEAGVEGVVVNTYHLMTFPGVKVLKSAGDIKKFMNFNGLVVSDSGGWQVYSLIHRSKNKGKITDRGVNFTIGGGNKKVFTPEESIKIQFDIKSDVIVCLDDFTPPDASLKKAEATVKRTIKWAEVSQKEYKKQLKRRRISSRDRPHLYAVVQGGYFKKLRKNCAEALVNLNFDGYGYGGYVIDDKGNLDLKLSKFVSETLPDNKPKFALGIGKPVDIANLVSTGWNIFDCTLPTRDARHQRLYTLNKEPRKMEDLQDPKNFSYVYINKQAYKNDLTPISLYCDCKVCKNFSKAYLRHLFKIRDTSAYRLATIHNLKFYSNIIKMLRDFS